MPIDLEQLCSKLDPKQTVLLFGAGSSVPSGVPTGPNLANSLAEQFNLPVNTYTLAETASLVEYHLSDRKKLVVAIRNITNRARPSGGLMNLPLYEWKAIYTTNYDTLIEQVYKRRDEDLVVYSSDFDFTVHTEAEATKLFKLHGTIEKDISDGHVSRLIVTEVDYDHTDNYRKGIYDRLKSDITGAHLLIVGHSLEDPDVRDIVNEALKLSAEVPGSRKVSLLLYKNDQYRAALLEQRGVTTCFAGIDDFFSEMSKHAEGSQQQQTGNVLDDVAYLRPVTVDVEHALTLSPDFGAMFNGWPATYADVGEGLTFERVISEEIEKDLKHENEFCIVVLGASGVGKTTAARQVLLKMAREGFTCWEHIGDHALSAKGWAKAARVLSEREEHGMLLIDDAHIHLSEINDLVDRLVSEKLQSIKLLCVSTKNNWVPRIKSPSIYKSAKEKRLRHLSEEEIDRLLRLVDNVPQVNELVEKSFSGFSRYERRRRLLDRCEAEMFVCMKNIFASEKFDDIILREFASLDDEVQKVYRFVAGLESAGVRVHRQLVMRLLGIEAQAVSSALLLLSDIVSEYTIKEREGVYGWKCRHYVIASIIAKYKYPETEDLVSLFSLVIQNVSPTYDVEVLSMRELCNIDSGIPRIPDKEMQNTLLRKMMSVVPGERVPRHRLIRNLIRMGEFEKAETEMRIFDNDFGVDGPVARYRIDLLLARAKNTKGILEEDRIAILDQARALAAENARKFPNNKNILVVYCQVGIEVFKRSGIYDVYDDAIRELKEAEGRIGDPDIARQVSRFESQIAGYSGNNQRSH